jgi:predicted MFS family arabinose efflux permease
VGGGLIIGPAVGSIIYAFVGYAGTFYIFGTFNILFGIALCWLLPEKRKNSSKITNDNESPLIDDEETDKSKNENENPKLLTDVTYCSLLK